MKTKTILGLFCLLLFVFSCREDKGLQWVQNKVIELDSITPIGLTMLNGDLWLADGDNNQVVQLDISGKLKNIYEDFDRPMHLSNDGKLLLIPEYGKDQITQMSGAERVALPLIDSLDAPGGVDYVDGKYAIADFYNHRILYGAGEQWISFGTEGKEQGQLYYPTDVQIVNDSIYVADAYNNRIQVFDARGKSILLFGSEEKMNAATGLYVSDNQVFVTDFENNRVVVYDKKGKLNQIIKENLSKPTDLLISDGTLYVTNYKSRNVVLFKQQ